MNYDMHVQDYIWLELKAEMDECVAEEIYDDICLGPEL